VVVDGLVGRAAALVPCSAGAGMYCICLVSACTFWGRREAAWEGWMDGMGRSSALGAQDDEGFGWAGYGSPVVHSRLAMPLAYVALSCDAGMSKSAL
jgi:hypothetical protein